MRIKVALGLVALISCGKPAPELATVRERFERDKPTAHVLEIVPEQSDPDNVHFRIRFRLLPDSVIHEEGWLYQRTYDGTLQLTSRNPIIGATMTPSRPEGLRPRP